jgi:hypothetical protein
MRVDDLLAQLDGVRRTSRGWIARCPAHGDKNPSLSIREGDDGRVLLHDFGGCPVLSICQALGLSVRDLFPDRHADPATIREAQRRRAVERRRRKAEHHTRALATDAFREAERLIELARGLDITMWSDDQLDRELNRLADAYDLLWAEGMGANGR